MKRGVILIILFTISSSLFAQDNQQLKLSFDNMLLSDALVHIRDEYTIHISFNHSELSQYKVSVDQTFPNPEDAISFLIADLPFRLEIEGGVIIILKTATTPTEHQISVKVLDNSNGESLPFSNVIVENRSLTTNYQGIFNFKSVLSEEFDVKISYVGYYIIDTVLQAGGHTIRMQPATINLREIVIEGVPIDNYSITGNEGGTLKLNHKKANYLPGNGDNSIFNLLRLQPGILASGEQTGDMIIWGSYQGQSKFDFDGYTLFGLKNFLENISTINPFSIKDIQVYKAGYGAELEGRVGGVVNLTGRDGRKDKPELKLNINNQTLNGFSSIPVAKNTVFSLAYRQSYTGLFSEEPVTVDRTSSGNQRGRTVRTDFTINPNYKYQDVNLKWSGSLNDDIFFASFFVGLDDFDYSIANDFGQSNFALQSNEQNDQYAGSVFYGKSWTRGQTKLQYSRSNLNSFHSNFQNVERSGQNPDSFTRDQEDTNSVSENKLQIIQESSWGNSNTWKAGIQFIENETKRKKVFGDVLEIDEKLAVSRFGYFAESEVNIENWNLRFGARADKPNHISKTYLQPRLSLSYGNVESARFSIAWGLYNQFLTKNVLIDQFGNLSYLWSVADNSIVPVISSEHLVLGLSGYKNGFNWRIEYFDKNTTGLSRYINANQSQGVFAGQSKSNGLDLFLSKEINRHYFWASYTLSSTRELFDYFIIQDYRRALHDQKHEIKAVAMFDLDPFYISANYVFGSGFPDPRPFDQVVDQENIYSRFDISARVKLRQENPYIESGVSILNVFNTQNIKYNNFLRLPENTLGSVNFHTEALPFTPTLYLKLIL